MSESALWEHAEVSLGGVHLHYVHAGPERGPLVVLLHGFPEFHLAWRHQIAPLARSGLRVVAPDLRGYHRSGKPDGVEHYHLTALVDDVAGLIEHLGHKRAHVVGHDWGGVIAWALAMRRPERLAKLAILNAPHPEAYRRELRGMRQALKSWYALFFQLPRMPEALLSRLDVGAFLRSTSARPEGFSPEVQDAYRAVWRTPTDWTPALNYYRVLAKRGFGKTRIIEVPTLLLWGDRDVALVPELTEGLTPWVPRLRVEHFPQASHWLMSDEPVRVNNLLIEFLGSSIS
ncbi:alpha/beta fold hydrolase [Deinococcus peraridilitoris]|uniref:Putative hydrolase or acyltransferase of alpha/beta superfamily n=1 Tax=Deinococcus peraridilitoris (strain DSM 19664 / LMG 22246 / CIP 109416 / KR-200) TaxID=937777 RepID=L0A5U3_DEIPD|nr:alpha/beta fold hydrolase [Deinococcus peraridilitoris]AFZ69216.1 putative hydrolase or acyltransferase of alpha/beta superfamily [Deinococcus peraridilitoris DSM 19664]